MKKMFMILFLSLLLTLTAQAKLTATVDRNQIAPGETFTLTLTTEANRGAVPELADLERNFTVLGTGQTSQLSIINGIRKSNLQWKITLSPKRSGEMIIPAIRMGNQFSRPIKISVRTAPQQPKGQRSKAAYLKATVDNQNPYVQSQIVYRLKLFYRDMGNGRLTDPTANNAVILRLGKDKRYQARLSSRIYEVLERDYAVFPQRSGKLVIQPAVFTGVNLAGPSAYRPAGPFFSQVGRPIRLISPEITLNVKSIPAAVQNKTWLPTNNLQLSQSWSPANAKFKVGDPITRTITIKAEGLTAAQLPDLAQGEQVNVNRYPNKPITRETLSGATIMSKRVEKTAYIPTTAGQLTFPSVTVSWWNTRTNKQITTTLPAKTFSILPAADASNSASKITTTSLVEKHNTQTQSAKTKSSQFPIWFWVALVLLITWCITLFIWWRRSGAIKPVHTVATADPNSTTLSIKQALAKVKSACQQNDFATLPHSLLSWAQRQWPDQMPQSLQAIAALCDNKPLAGQLLLLDKHLYGSDEVMLDLQTLWTCISQYKPNQRRSITTVDLPPLYPETKSPIL